MSEKFSRKVLVLANLKKTSHSRKPVYFVFCFMYSKVPIVKYKYILFMYRVMPLSRDHFIL